MNSAVNFVFESGVSISLFALIYVFFLRKETFFKLNRFFLLGAILFSIALPFFKFRIFAPKQIMLAEITVTPYKNLLEAVTVYSHNLSGNIEHAILSTETILFIYVGGVLIFLGLFLFRIGQIVLLIRKNKVQYHNGFKLVVLEKELSPFSFLDYIFVSRSLLKKEGNDRMMAHELEHVKQGHTFDVLLLEFLTVFQWFNPFMWMLRRAIRENHEFLADQAVLSSGITRGYYKKLLLNQFVGDQLVISNNFNYSLIKNRIKMMSKIESSKLAITKILFGVVVAVVLVVAFACEQKESEIMEPATKEPMLKVAIQNNELKFEGTPEMLAKLKEMFPDESGYNIKSDSLGNIVLKKNNNPGIISRKNVNVFYIVEDMPEFPGGEDALRSYISKSVNYPEVAQQKKIQGKVYVSFIVNKNGNVVDAKIARGVAPSIDNEALRVVRSLPKWIPGKQSGEAVNVSYTVPINFVLQ